VGTIEGTLVVLKIQNKAEINKRNFESMAGPGATLHTGGSIPHRLH